MRAAAAWLCVLAASFLVAGCGEKVQTVPLGGERKADSRGWQITDNGFIAPGWTPGDEASWDSQLKRRAQAQNDFAQRK